MAIVLHLSKDGRIENLVIGGESFKKRVVFDVIKDGRKVATFTGDEVAGFTVCESLAEAYRLQTKLDGSLQALRRKQELKQSEFQRQLEEIRRKREHDRMIGRAT